MADNTKDTEQLLAEAEADGYVDVPPDPILPGHPDWVEPAEGCTPVPEEGR
jgi:hypothetical protein